MLNVVFTIPAIREHLLVSRWQNKNDLTHQLLLLRYNRSLRFRRHFELKS